MKIAHTTARVFTAAHIERLQRTNRLARRLKAMGYRITATGVQPFGDAMPTIGIDLGVQGSQPLYAIGNGALRDARIGIERTVIDGVWVSWPTGEVPAHVVDSARRVAA